jgi:iron complex outermembrane receptor protein
VILPLVWGNQMRGDTSGVEAWANWQIADWWLVSSGVTAMRKLLSFKPGASGLLGLAEAADDPNGHASLRSSMNFGSRLTFDAVVRYVGSLPDPALRAYAEMDARIAWQAGKFLELSLGGANLLHARHYEFPAPNGAAISRSVVAEALWRN